MRAARAGRRRRGEALVPTQPLCHPVTASTIPWLRHELERYFAAPSSIPDIAAALASPPAAATGIARWHRQVIAAAEMYFVNDDMTSLAGRMGADLETYALNADDELPNRAGFLVWATPLPADAIEGASACAVVWNAGAAKVHVTFYGHRAAFAVGSMASNLRAGSRNLALLWEVQLDADGCERAWSSTGDGEVSAPILRTLLATWLLIRQPADARRSLAQLSPVEADPQYAGRIRGQGGDPARTVRYVTLRTAVRAEPGESADARADRVYQHRWFVRPHRRRYPDASHPEGQSRRWVGPYLVTPANCEEAPILGVERVNVLRR